MIEWLTDGDINAHRLDELMKGMGIALHPAAVRHLLVTDIEDALPFPRLERHGTYLFGIVRVPSDANNASGDFDRVSFVVAHDWAIASLLCHPTSQVDWAARRDELAAVDETDDTPDGGQFLHHLLEMAITDLRIDADAMLATLQQRLVTVGPGIDLTRPDEEVFEVSALSGRERRGILADLRRIVPALNAVAGEIPTIRRVVSETLAILERIVTDDDRTELRVDASGRRRELFSLDLEIHLMDTFIEGRMLLAVLDEIEALLANTRDLIKQLSDEENVAAGRFTGAIASIMLLPTFIVGLYGQNFVDMPETDWHYGYLFSWGTIVALTTFQVMFFRRRDWL